MGVKIGDVVIDRTYRESGTLGVVVGLGSSQPILINHSYGVFMNELKDYFSTFEGLEVIGHIDFEKLWKEAERIESEATNDSNT